MNRIPAEVAKNLRVESVGLALIGATILRDLTFDAAECIEALEAKVAAVNDADVWTIRCWIYGSDKFTDGPDCLLGPYESQESAEVAAVGLTCDHTVRRLRLRLNPPKWAVER